ncbi:Protein GrpE [Saliniradius amylolyticus]|uniref:Protein GrpE n=1 Tax=Saliniradius amylolyticus TaxID=2183582 RepID=A0A2S2E3R2_9ALTE|nr:nucleotide exchange factor GrpE [Saliniradius amylolyticus]AWL12281.1 Protein GrpE [Saliniradius amylolyticus]
MSNEPQKPEQPVTPEDVEAHAEAAAENTGGEEQPTPEEAIADTEVSPEEARIAELEQQVAEAENRLQEQKDSVLRAKADMENARRRAQADAEKAKKFALEKFAGELLDVLDNLERALQVADPDNDTIKPVVEGVELTYKSFYSTMEKFGVSAIDPQGDPFNPDKHQAMSMQESAEVEPNTVIAVMQKGYELNGRLLRPAMVMVSRAPESGVDTKA